MRFDLDPQTQKEVFSIVFLDFENIIDDLLKDNGEEFYKNLDWIDLAKLFYVNGYIHGASECVKNPKFEEAIKLLGDEIAYQKKYKKK